MRTAISRWANPLEIEELRQTMSHFNFTSSASFEYHVAIFHVGVKQIPSSAYKYVHLELSTVTSTCSKPS